MFIKMQTSQIRASTPDNFNDRSRATSTQSVARLRIEIRYLRGQAGGCASEQTSTGGELPG
jgi:hypothetical protein